MTQAKNPVKAVRRTIEIIDHLRETDSARITEISDAVGISKGSVHCHLATLNECGYVTKDGNEYKLGLQFIDLAHHARKRIDIYDLVTSEIDALARDSGEMALFMVEEDGEAVCLYKAEGENAVQTEIYVGYRNDLYHTAVGKAMLAVMPETDRDRIIRETDLESLTPHTITDEDSLRNELEDIRRRAIAYNREETIQGLVGVGTPIRDQNGSLYGAVSIIGPVRRMDDDRLNDEIPEMIRRAVNIIEINSTSL